MKPLNLKPDLNVFLASTLILLAVCCRLLPHPMNFTPVLAVAIFGGAILPRRLALAVPLVALWLSDLALGYGFSAMSAVIYSCFAAGVALGWMLRENCSWPRALSAALAGSTLFFLVTNFVVWLGPMMAPPFDYPHTFAGLMKCYVMALPFFRNALAGDLCWTMGLFTAYEAARHVALTRLEGRLSS